MQGVGGNPPFILSSSYLSSRYFSIAFFNSRQTSRERVVKTCQTQPPRPPSSSLFLLNYCLQGGNQILANLVQRVVPHSIPTLRSITVAGRRGKDSGRVAAIVGVLVPVAVKRHRLVPKLTLVELWHGANGVVKAGKAIAAGLWPALEELVMPSHHGNIGHFSGQVDALRRGCAPNLRVLDLKYQLMPNKKLSNSILWALSAGKCPHMEHLNFGSNSYHFDERPSLDALRGALQACSNLRELRMDCTGIPDEQLCDVLAALQAGKMPLLTFLLSIRTPKRANKVTVDALKKVTASRIPRIALRIFCT